MKDVGSKTDVTRHRQGRARVRNILLGYDVAGYHDDHQITPFGVRPREKSADLGILLGMLKNNAAVRDRRIIEHLVTTFLS